MMDPNEITKSIADTPETMLERLRVVESRDWWLWGLAVVVTLALTIGIVCMAFPTTVPDLTYRVNLADWIRGLAALVLLFDIYTAYQHLQLQRIRRQLMHQTELFQLITENAADMIAVVDVDGNRLYNSPAYQKILGYTPEELSQTPATEQIHPDDCPRVQAAAVKAMQTGEGQRIEYRIRHKDGSWRTLESTASSIVDVLGKVEKLVIVNRDITDRRIAEERLAHNALHDSLTNLPNRSLFADRLQRAFARARRHPQLKTAVLFIDVDSFKFVNDSLGHPAGDTLLVQIGSRLQSCLREDDTISRINIGTTGPVEDADRLARVGGDEFTVLLEDIKSPSDAIRVAERIQQKLGPPFMVEDHQIVITASIGIALSTASYSDAEEILRDSEIAMYRAKRAGKGKCEVSDAAMHSAARKRLQLESDMRRGLVSGEFETFYQPLVCARTGRVAGFEALTRWRRNGSFVLPAEFINVADETGMILHMNHLLMREAFGQLKRWQEQFKQIHGLTMSVNISPKQFNHPDLVEEIDRIIRETGIRPECLDLEITESIAMADSAQTEGLFKAFKRLGVSLSIDDFGTGYSSLSRLRAFPVDCLKIDRSFITTIVNDRDTLEIVRGIIILAHSLGLKVVAEGVETAAQLDRVRRLECDLAQGYFFSKPVDASGIERFLNGVEYGVVDSKDLQIRM